MADPIRDLRLSFNVGETLQRQYVGRYQRALDAILAIVEPHDRPQAAPTQDGSGFGRGYTAGMRAMAGAVMAAMQAEILGEDGDDA